jgi:predicted phosphodiesterase
MGGPDQASPRDQIVLFHLSDPHIGTCLMPSAETFHRLRTGYNPHDFRLLRPLQLAMRHARQHVGLSEHAPLDIVISGDLTQSGLDNDYATAMALLHHRLQWRFGTPARWLGFGWARERTFTVPGNHDQWRRPTYQTGYTRGLAPGWFEATPWKRTIESSGGTFRLELYGVDSNSGLEDSSDPGRRNLFAGGALSSDELEHLTDHLERTSIDKPDQAAVRAFVCHHAFSTGGAFFDARPLSADSRRALERLAARYGVSVALTGHTHAFHVQDWPVGGEPELALKELRCATTLQGTRARPGLQGFWVHQIVRPAGSQACEWTAWKYQAAAGWFDLDAVAPLTFVIPAERGSPGR